MPGPQYPQPIAAPAPAAPAIFDVKEFEEGLIGGLIIDPGTIEGVAALLQPESFFVSQCGIVYRAILDVWKAGRAVDYTTVLDQLDTTGGAVALGLPPASYLVGVINSMLSPAYVEPYANIVRDASLRRRAFDVFAKYAPVLSTGERGTGQDTLEQMAAELADLVGTHGQALNTRSFDAVLRATLDEIEERKRHPGLPGLATGLSMFDSVLGGFRPGLYVVAARPSVGKTTWVTDILRRILTEALKQGKPKRAVAVSMEQRVERLAQKTLAAVSGIAAQDLDQGTFPDDDWMRLLKAANELAGLDIQMLDATQDGLSVSQVISECKRLHRVRALDIVVIDYLNLFDADAGEKEQIERIQLDRAIIALKKRLVNRLGIPVILICQMGRSVEQRTSDSDPQFMDLFGTSGIERHADAVIFLHRQVEKKKEGETGKDEISGVDKRRILKVIVAKNREGATGYTPMYFDAEHSRFDELELVREPLEISGAPVDEDIGVPIGGPAPSEELTMPESYANLQHVKGSRDALQAGMVPPWRGDNDE